MTFLPLPGVLLLVCLFIFVLALFLPIPDKITKRGYSVKSMVVWSCIILGTICTWWLIGGWVVGFLL